MTENIREFELLLGHAALRLWPEFPREVQEDYLKQRYLLIPQYETTWQFFCTTDTRKLHIHPSPQHGVAVRRTQKSFTEMEHEHRGIKYFALFVLVEPNGTGERGSD